MKTFHGFAAILTLAVGVAACVDRGERADDMAGDTLGQMPPDQTAPAFSDAQIAHAVQTANDADIANGELARQKGRSAEIKSFGELMISDHTALNQQIERVGSAAGITPEDNPTSQQLMSQQQQVRQQLESLSGAQFDSVYIAHEVDMHQALLDMLDQTLIPSAQNADLRNLLTQGRAAVEAHLNRARDIQNSLRSN